jgi:hypothetical protein
MIKSITPNVHILRRNPTNKWVDFKQPINWIGAPKIYTCVSINLGQYQAFEGFDVCIILHSSRVI